MTKVLGLTGGIASGKTTISNYFRSLNIPVIDADSIAREVMRAGKPAVAELAQVFGSEILLADGEVNREYLGNLVFASASKRKQLNQIVQPKIRRAIKEAIEKCLKKESAMIVLDIPLLYEENYENLVDEIMVVYVDPNIQKDRLLQRDEKLRGIDAQNRIDSQMSLAKKAEKADIVINNNDSIEKSIHQVNCWLLEEYEGE